VGINLPAYLVVIKGTSMWQGQGFRDYSDVDIQVSTKGISGH
jgi:replicative superfamily II helicase